MTSVFHFHPARVAGWVALSLATAARAGDSTASAEELERFPLIASLPGDPPADGIRHWGTNWRPIGITGSYVSVVQRDGQYELWRNTWSDTLAGRAILVYRGPEIDRLGAGETVFDSSIIDDVFEPGRDDILSPDRGFTRPFVTYDPDVGYIMLASVGPGYTFPLMPSLCISATGHRGDWEYRGRLKGEPMEEKARRPRLWSDGGSLHRLADGRWRIYLNGFGVKVAAVEADTLEGPWAFLRTADGAIRDLLPGGHGRLWPQALQVRQDQWHLWIADRWPTQAIWHFWSTDGLTWQPYGRQPEITRRGFGNHGIKCLRTFLDPDGETIVGLLSVWGRRGDEPPGWRSYQGRMATGPPPADASP